MRASVIVALTAAVGLVAASALSSYQLGILALVSAFTVASLAQNLLSGFADVPSLGNVAFLGTSAFVAASLMTQTGVPALIALTAGVVAAGALGFVVGFPALRISGMHLAIATVALVFVLQEIMTQQDAGRGVVAITVRQPGWLLSDRGLFVTALIVSACSYALIRNLLSSSGGRALVAVGEDRVAASAVGIDPVSNRLLAFVLSATLTGFAGVIYLYHLQTITPTAFPLDLSIAFLAMIIIGGSRSLVGSILGAVIIGLLPELLRLLPATVGSLNIEQNVNALYALLLLLALRFFPDGIWPNLVSRFEYLRRPNHDPAQG